MLRSKLNFSVWQNLFCGPRDKTFVRLCLDFTRNSFKQTKDIYLLSQRFGQLVCTSSNQNFHCLNLYKEQPQFIAEMFCGTDLIPNSLEINKKNQRAFSFIFIRDFALLLPPFLHLSNNF